MGVQGSHVPAGAPGRHRPLLLGQAIAELSPNPPNLLQSLKPAQVDIAHEPTVPDTLPRRLCVTPKPCMSDTVRRRVARMEWPGCQRHRGDGVQQAPELEDLGYSTIWIAGALLTDLGRVADIARVTRDALVGTAIIAADHLPAEAVTSAYAEMEVHPGRFVVGLGGAHGPTPLRTLGTYLDRLDDAASPVPRSRRVLAALGPRMLDLARDRTAGALPVLVTPEYTAQARARLGSDALLVIGWASPRTTSPSSATVSSMRW